MNASRGMLFDGGKDIIIGQKRPSFFDIMGGCLSMQYLGSGLFLLRDGKAVLGAIGKLLLCSPSLCYIVQKPCKGGLFNLVFGEEGGHSAHFPFDAQGMKVSLFGHQTLNFKAKAIPCFFIHHRYSPFSFI